LPEAAGAGRVAAGPGLWEDLLADLRREGLIGELLADGVIAAAVAEGGHGHRLDRALTAEVTALCVIAGSLFPDQGYDLILARVFGMPGVPVKPGTVTPSGPALSKARERLGEQVMRRIFELDAARPDIVPGAGGGVRGARGRHQAEDPDRRAPAGRHAPVEGRRGRGLPRRRERPGR
jgi:Insertion element 4 transposase N-terminal